MGNENDLKELEKKIPTNELGFLEYERLQLQTKMNKALEEENIGTYKNLIQAYEMVVRERNDYIKTRNLCTYFKDNGEIDVDETLNIYNKKDVYQGWELIKMANEDSLEWDKKFICTNEYSTKKFLIKYNFHCFFKKIDNDWEKVSVEEFLNYYNFKEIK